MNLIRILVIAVLGSTAAPVYNVPFRATLFSIVEKAFTAWKVALSESAGTNTSLNFSDADGDCVASGVFDVVPGEAALAVHAQRENEDGDLLVIRDLESCPHEDPIVKSVTGDPLIVISPSASAGRLSLGQPVTVSDGMIDILDGLVHENTELSTAADLLAIDVSSLPTFNGEAQVAHRREKRAIWIFGKVLSPLSPHFPPICLKRLRVRSVGHPDELLSRPVSS